MIQGVGRSSPLQVCIIQLVDLSTLRKPGDYPLDQWSPNFLISESGKIGMRHLDYPIPFYFNSEYRYKNICLSLL
jgi:hypothetical protein